MADRKNDGRQQPASTFKRFAQGCSLASLLFALGRLGCATRDYASYVAALGQGGQDQGMAEGAYKGRLQLEQQLQQDTQLDTSQTLADFLREGDSNNDQRNYPDRVDPRSGQRPRLTDATAHLLAAKEFRFSIDPPQIDPATDPSEPQGPQKYLNPDAAQETGHQFELRKADGSETLAFTRDTSYLVPRGQLDYASPSREQRPQQQLDAARDQKAIVMLDTSGSMCSNHDNFATKTFNGQSYQIYLPSAFALSVADFYVHQRHTAVSGYTFSTDSSATPFTQNMGTLANQFSQLQCAGTYINYSLLEQTLHGSNAAVDIFMITDADILSEQDMREAIHNLQGIMGNSSLNRVFFIEWRTDAQGYNQRKDDIIRETGMDNAFYSKITRPEDMAALVRSLNEKLERSSP